MNRLKLCKKQDNYCKNTDQKKDKQQTLSSKIIACSSSQVISKKAPNTAETVTILR